MTYKQFIAHSQKMQRRYIADEMKRNAKLSKLWYDYKAKASKLGFHPLDRREIEARSDQLKQMLARIDETHGDTPGQRALWEMRQAESAQAASMTPGQIAYEQELKAKPLYHDGTPRKPWLALAPEVKQNWEGNPTPRWTEEAVQ